MKEQTIESILKARFNYIYCDSCANEDEADCDECYRKQMKWTVSSKYAKMVAKEILASGE